MSKPIKVVYFSFASKDKRLIRKRINALPHERQWLAEYAWRERKRGVKLTLEELHRKAGQRYA